MDLFDFGEEEKSKFVDLIKNIPSLSSSFIPLRKNIPNYLSAAKKINIWLKFLE